MTATFDPLLGLRFAADGRDLRPIRRDTEPNDWALAVIRAKCWQIAGQWRYDRRRGLKWDLLFEPGADLRVVQEMFRRAISSVIPQVSLTVARVADDIVVTFRGPPSSGLDGTFSVFEALRDREPGPRVVGYEVAAPGLRVRFDQTLDPAAVPELAAFELFGTTAEVTAVALNGAQLNLTCEPGADSFALVYNPRLIALRNAARVQVEPFRLEVEGSGAGILLTEDGFTILTEAGDPITV